MNYWIAIKMWVKRLLIEKLKLYDEVRKFHGQDTSLVTVKDQARGTLNLAITIGNTVSKLRVNLKKVPKTDGIHLHKEICDIIYTNLLQATLQISKLQFGKKRIEDLL